MTDQQTQKMLVLVDKKTSTIYVKVRNDKVFREIALEPHGIKGVEITVEVNKKGKLVGVEILL